ncbi:hypothetical protein FisN_23Hh002 [Fistulifera solaris]|uniref:Uncharacterized protein n=1 Tax=Fistulifera solaris TaxID=1519565 RepID=A0A1Z5KNL9_FISSO|nr:hypothetical protein FisN_23Hh002 [Fistulifera solaris]|eukprot:GAX27528.1 hypothetical protein FisN_23Hh002 [Fistulifera solaris]
MKVTWLDEPAKSDRKRSTSVPPIERKSNLTSLDQSFESAKNESFSLASTSAADVASSVISMISSNETKRLDTLDSTSEENATLSSPIAPSPSVDLEASKPLDDIDVDAAPPFPIVSSSRTTPLMPDDNFTPYSVTFEPGPPPAPLLPKESGSLVSPKFEPGSPPAPLVPDVNTGTTVPAFEARSPPAPLLPNDSLAPGSPSFEPGSPPAPLLPKDTFSPLSSYKSDAPLSSNEFDPTKPPTNFGSFVQEIAKDTMPDFGGGSVKPVEEFGSFVKQVAKGSMPVDGDKADVTIKVDILQNETTISTPESSDAATQLDSATAALSVSKNTTSLPLQLISDESNATARENFASESPPAPLVPDVNTGTTVQAFKARSPPAPLLPNDSLAPGSPSFEPGSPPAPLLPKDTFSPPSSYKSEAPLSSIEFDPTKPPTNFGAFVQEIAKDMMPDFGGGSAKPVEEFGSFVKEVAKGSMPVEDTRADGTPKVASDFGAYVEAVANDSLPKEPVQGGTASNPTVIVDDEIRSDSVAEDWDPRKPPSNFGSFVNQLAKSKMSGEGGGSESENVILDTQQDDQGWDYTFAGSDSYSESGDAKQDYSADGGGASSSQRSTNAYDRAETWDPWKFDVMSQTLGKSSQFPSSTLEDFAGSGLETSLGARAPSPSRGAFERAETWDPWKFDVMSQTLGKSTIFPSTSPADYASDEASSDSSGNQDASFLSVGSQASSDPSFDRAKSWDPWKFDVMSQTLGKSTMFPSSSPEDFANTGISLSSTNEASGSTRDSSPRSSFQRAETWDPWKFDVLSQTLGKSTHFPSSAPQDFSTGRDQVEDSPTPQPGQRMISYEKTETWDPRTFNVLSQTLGKSTSFPAPEPPSPPSNEPSWGNDSSRSSDSLSSNSFSRAEKWDPWAFDVLKQTLGKSTIFPSSTPQDFSSGGDGGSGNDWFASSQDSRPTSPLGPSSSTYSPQGVFNRPRTVSGTFDPSGSLSGGGRVQGVNQGSVSSWNSASSTTNSGSITDYTQPNGVFDPAYKSGVTSYLQDATRAHFGDAPTADEDSFPVQNSQISGDYSESRFKILTGEAAPLHWDPERETWVEQGTGKPVEATSKSEIAPPSKQQQVSVAPAVVGQTSRQKKVQPTRQSPTSSVPAKNAEQTSSNANDANVDRKKFFADLFEQNEERSSATIYDGDSSREAIFRNMKRPSPRQTSSPSVTSTPLVPSTQATRGTDASSPPRRPVTGPEFENTPERKLNRDRVGADRNSSNRGGIFTEFLRSNYQPGSLRLDIPENLFGLPTTRQPEYIDNTANRGFGPFQGGWGRPPQYQDNPAESVFIDLPSEEEQRQEQFPPSPYGDSSPFESDNYAPGSFGESSAFEARDFPSSEVPFSDSYGDFSPFQSDALFEDGYQGENDIFGEYRGVPPLGVEDLNERPAAINDAQSSSWQNGKSYLDSMRRPDEESKERNSVFDWGSYVTEQNGSEPVPSLDFPGIDPGGYYTETQTMYDSERDDYPPAISFAEASRPQMRSYLDSLYKSSQTNGYSVQEDPLSEFEAQLPQEQSMADDEQPLSSAFLEQEEFSVQPPSLFPNPEWNPKEGADPNQNPFARYGYGDSNLQDDRSSADVSVSESSYRDVNNNENVDIYTETKSDSDTSSSKPRRGTQVYPEVKNSWFGGGSYLDSMSQRRWDDGQSN